MDDNLRFIACGEDDVVSFGSAMFEINKLHDFFMNQDVFRILLLIVVRKVIKK